MCLLHYGIVIVTFKYLICQLHPQQDDWWQLREPDEEVRDPPKFHHLDGPKELTDHIVDVFGCTNSTMGFFEDLDLASK